LRPRHACLHLDVQVPFFPPLQRHEAFTPAVCRQLINEAITPDGGGERLAPDLAIHSVRPWTMSAEVAQRMRQVGTSATTADKH